MNGLVNLSAEEASKLLMRFMRIPPAPVAQLVRAAHL